MAMKLWIENQIKNVKTYFIRPRRIAMVYALAFFLSLFVLWLLGDNWVENQLLQDERDTVAAQVDTLGTSLTLAVNQRLMLTTSVHSYLEAKSIPQEAFTAGENQDVNDFRGFVSKVHSSTAGIRNIAIAPNGIMQFVYPYEENKSVLGYEPALDERSNVRDEVRRAIETEEIVLSLPYELIQGGQGLIARQAIYVDGKYWGLANIVLDVPPLLEESGIFPMPQGLSLALKNQAGQVFIGSEDVFLSNPVTYVVKLPEGSWELAGIPSAGWGISYTTTMWFYRIMGMIGVISISLVVYLFMNRRERLAFLVDKRTHELAQSNQTLISVLEGIEADVYVADMDTYEILFANKHIQESYRDNLVGKLCHDVFRNEASVCQNCKNSGLLDANGNPTGVTLWEGYNLVQGRWFHNADRAILWHDGRYVHLQIATDITEHKKNKEKLEALLQEKDILLAEVHHRVKNNLQVVISLLDLQAREIEDDHFRMIYQESRNRIKSMALVHEQLYRSKKYARIDFGQYIEQLTSTLFNMYEVDPNQIHLQLKIENVYLDLEKAIPCGLLVNELITNSLKYAFPKKRNGKLWVELRPQNGRMYLTIGDDGTGLPNDVELRSVQSMGLQLVNLLATHDLHGNIEIQNKKGTQFHIDIPLQVPSNEDKIAER